jgi:hypothetical protein
MSNKVNGIWVDRYISKRDPLYPSHFSALMEFKSD